MFLITCVREFIRDTSHAAMKRIQDANWSIESCELHKCMRQVMRLGRWFGFFPVVGLDSPLITNLRFSVKSVYGFYHVATMFSQLFLATCFLLSFFASNLSLSTTSNTFFYANSLLSGIFLTHLAKHWPSLVLKAKEIEQSITDLKISMKTPLKLKAVAYSIMFLALVEHLLALLHGWNVMATCYKEYDIVHLLLKFHFLRMPPALQKWCPVSVWSAVFHQVVNFQATFLWTFLDVMIICISLYLTEYFRQLNKFISNHKQKTAVIWEKIRVTHCSLVTLVNIVNRRISHCVLLALLTDLFYVCQQLFNTLSNTGLSVAETCEGMKLANTMPEPTQYIYYSYSFLFLVARVSVLSVVAANVNSVALRPCMALGEVPAAIYNIGTQRFLRQLNYTTIAISGWFFYVTRKMILKIAGTIITYELVLLQYRQLEKVTDGHTSVDNTTSYVIINIS